MRLDVTCIVSLIGEGGALSIEGQAQLEGWRYRRAAGSFLGEESSSTAPWEKDLAETLAALGPRWLRLHPKHVHPAFRQLLWSLAQGAGAPDWEEACEMAEVQERECLVPPPPELYVAAAQLLAACNAHCSGDREVVLSLLASSNMQVVRAWTERAWGPQPKGSRVPAQRPVAADLDLKRMPDALLRGQLHQRDGFHCRYCGVPVVRAEVRKRLVELYPEANLWGRTNASQHAALQAMWAQYDHVVPHVHGGKTALENMVVSCAPCNYGRMQYTLEELRLSDPRSRLPIASSWAGLEQLLAG